MSNPTLTLVLQCRTGGAGCSQAQPSANSFEQLLLLRVLEERTKGDVWSPTFSHLSNVKIIPRNIVMDDRKTYCTVWETPFSHRTQYATSEPSATRSNLVSMAWRQEACTYLQEASRVGLIELLTAQDASSLAFSALLMVPRSFHPRPLAATEEQLPLKAMSPQHLSNSSIAYCEKDR